MSSNTLELNRRQLFMLPTRHGWYFSVMLLVMFLAAINYNNGLAYGFVFLLAAAALLSMLHTHNNVSGLRITANAAEPVFAGEKAHFPLSLHNPSAQLRINLWLMTASERQRFNLPARSQTTLYAAEKTSRRGWMLCPQITFSSDFPLGLLYTWSRRFTPQTQGLVYPAPAGEQPLPTSQGLAGERNQSSSPTGDDFLGLREYQQGDSFHHVHWKATARSQRLQSKQFGGSETGVTWLEWDQIEVADTESKLSQLCRWVLEADNLGLRYGLRLPGYELKPAHGDDHRIQCLKTLALWEVNRV